MNNYEEGLWTPTFNGRGRGDGEYVLAGSMVAMKAVAFLDARHIEDIPMPAGYPFEITPEPGQPQFEVKECGRPRWWKRLLGYKRYLVSVRVNGRQR